MLKYEQKEFFIRERKASGCFPHSLVIEGKSFIFLRLIEKKNDVGFFYEEAHCFLTCHALSCN